MYRKYVSYAQSCCNRSLVSAVPRRLVDTFGGMGEMLEKYVDSELDVQYTIALPVMFEADQILPPEDFLPVLETNGTPGRDTVRRTVLHVREHTSGQSASLPARPQEWCTWRGRRSRRSRRASCSSRCSKTRGPSSCSHSSPPATPRCSSGASYAPHAFASRLFAASVVLSRPPLPIGASHSFRNYWISV